MISKIVLNCLSVYLVMQYLKNKQRIRAATTTTTANSYMENFDRKQTYIAMVMSTFSLLEHMLYITSYVLYFFYFYELSYFIYISALLFVAIKHFLIFFILLALNNLFRNQVKQFFNY
jgi:hypothetical protein